jgi:hypothetical protein
VSTKDNGFRMRTSIDDEDKSGSSVCKGNLTDLRRILHLSLAKGNPK